MAIIRVGVVIREKQSVRFLEEMATGLNRNG